MRKFLLILILCIIPLKVSAAVLSVSSAQCSAGDSVSITVSVADNPGIAGLLLRLDYDKQLLTPTLVSKGEALSEGALVPNITDGVTVLWFNTTNVSDNGNLFTVQFAVSETARGDLAIGLRFNEGDISNESLENVEFSVENGKISVNGNSTTVSTGSGALNTISQSPPTVSTGSVSAIQEEIERIITPTIEPNTKAETTTFLDLNGHAWARNEIEYLAENGIIKGTSGTTFSPADNIKRGDFVILLARMLGLENSTNDSFLDVAPYDYYYSEICAAKQAGLVMGSENMFYPESAITRQDMFVISARALGLNDNHDITYFNDYEEIADYAKESLSSLVHNGLVQGDANCLNPNKPATRAETAVFVYRMKNIWDNM